MGVLSELCLYMSWINRSCFANLLKHNKKLLIALQEVLSKSEAILAFSAYIYTSSSSLMYLYFGYGSIQSILTKYRTYSMNRIFFFKS